MITILLQGGLGNQMFQYALGETLRARGVKVDFIAPHLNMSAPEGPHDRNLPSYGLGDYDTDVTFHEGPLPAFYYNQEGSGYDPAVLELNNVLLRGYWQSEKYFDHLGDGLPLGHPIVHRFFPKKGLTAEVKELAKRLMDDDAVALQVRRGDFLLFPDFHSVATRDYFLRGIEETGKKKVYIFTDDEAWCRENLPGEIVNTGNRHWDITLMAAAPSLVISNSTFGWWGAWLGDYNFLKPGRKVIVPTKWFEKHVVGEEDIVPTRWIKL